MRWTAGPRSANLEDRRGQRMGGALPKLGIGGFLLLAILSFVFKTDLFSLLGGGAATTGAPVESGPVASTPEEEKMVDFVSFVLDDTQDTWSQVFAQDGQQYPPARLVLFRDGTQSGCGFGQAAMGPFYCPADQKVYIDLAFYDELQSRFGAPGDFAQAYVIAHEVGHHVQNVLGLSDQVREAQQRNPSEANELSVRLELQADCFAGIWARSAQQENRLEVGDIEEALGAASAVGDDRIQSQSGGGVNPETWTHGSAQQRASWFRRGFESGNVESCDTFQARG
ncbi:MAG TPA: neutral zinc metallopeptidase [Thermoanaerobaculia bacterium]|nr:neutral zinc metallopeptidase [Thermoanaerobaculia bacterium]